MLFTCQQEELRDLLKRFSHIAASERSNVPQLSHVKVEVRDNQVIFTGTDLEVFLVETVSSNEGNKVGHCTFPVKSLLELVKNLSPTKPIKIELIDEKRLQLRQGRNRYSLATTDPTLFPSFDIPLDGYAPIAPEALVDAISTVDYAIFPDETRAGLGGILLEPTEDEGFIRAVASDGRRLATCKTTGVLKSQIVISKKSAEAIKKILPTSEEASILANDTHLFVTLDNSTLGCRLLAQQFPNYAAAFPQGGHNLLKISRDDTIKALKRICLFAGDKTSGRTRMIISKEGIEFRVRDQRGDAVEQLDVIEGSEIKSEIELQFNPFLLQQSLENLRDEATTIRIYSDLSPILLFDSEYAMALVMPQKK